MNSTSALPDSATRSLATPLAGASLLVATILAPALASPAGAATAPPTTPSHQHHALADHRVVHHDARHDVLRFDFRSDTSRPAPRDRATDVTATVVDHQADRLVLKARSRHLSRSGYRLMVAEVLTSDRARFTLVVDYSTQPIDTRLSLERFASGRDVRCPGASWSISGPAHRVAASIPASCLGDPGWVRVGLALTAAPHDLETSWADDSRARGRIGDRHLELGPRQHEARAEPPIQVPGMVHRRMGTGTGTALATQGALTRSGLGGASVILGRPTWQAS